MATLEAELKGLREDVAELKVDIRSVTTKLDSFFHTISENYVTKSEVQSIKAGWEDQFKEYQSKVSSIGWRDRVMVSLFSAIITTLALWFLADLFGRN